MNETEGKKTTIRRYLVWKQFDKNNIKHNDVKSNNHMQNDSRCNDNSYTDNRNNDGRYSAIRALGVLILLGIQTLGIKVNMSACII